MSTARLDLYRVGPRAIPRVAAALAADRIRLRRTAGITFAKVLGCGHGSTYGLGDTDLHRWAVLTCFDDRDAARAFDGHPTVQRWEAVAEEVTGWLLDPVASVGRWSGREPFGRPAPRRPAAGTAVAVLTRARLAPRRAPEFWAAAPRVGRTVAPAPGLVLGLPIGEAPLGLQGTFSVWESAAAVREFAGSAVHRQVVERTRDRQWYAEELFARFTVLESVHR